MNCLFDGFGWEFFYRVVKIADEEGLVPLHSAASIRNFEIVEALLNKGQYFTNFI